MCTDGTGDADLGNSGTRETQCTQLFPGTERQRTPGNHEETTLFNLYA